MTRVQGCNTSAADLGCRDALVGPSRRLGCKCLKKRRRAGCLSSQAFRANRPTEFSPEAPKGASRLLKSRRAGSLPVEQAEKAYLRARQRDRVADHAQQSPTKRAPGRLLQRNNADREPAEVDKQRQQARDRQQALDKEQDSDQNLLVSRQRASNRQKVPDTQQSSSTSVSLHLQETQSSDQQNAKPPGKRYSQAAGKLSRKDWQVTTEWLSMDMQDGLLDETIWKDLLTDCDLEPWYRPQATVYHKLGFTKADFRKVVKSRGTNGLLQLRVSTIQSKLRFFKNELSFDDEDIRRLLVKCPRVMEHKIESTIRPHLDFLQQHGVAKGDLGKVIQRAPHIFQLSLEGTLQPRLDFLKQQLGVTQEGLTKLIVKQPSVLTYSTSLMQERVDFLTASGIPLEAVAKAVVSHPQLLHYLPESMQEKMSYLRHIGMGSEQVTKTILRLPQLLSLDVRQNLKPKYSYLRSQLGGTVNTLCAYPGYFSLSLPGRIIPRHRYLQLVRARPIHPFPMGYLKMSDDKFAANIAATPLAQFASFRDQMIAGKMQ